MKTIAARIAGIAAISGLFFSVSAQAETLADICGDCQFEKWASCGQFLEGINFDRNGHAWAVSLQSGEILEITAGTCTARAKTGGRANGARFHQDGRLFITDNVRGILAYNPADGSIAVIADKIGGKPMVNANDLVFDAKGGIYVTVPGTSHFLSRTGKVGYIAPGSNNATVIAEGLAYPNGIVLHPGGKFLNVGLFGIKTIMTIPSVENAGGPRPAYAAVHTEGGIGPDGMGMDSEGRAYWANFLSGAVGITDKRGFVAGYAKLPDEAGLWTTNLAFWQGYLYVTEAGKGEVWRMKVKTTGQELYYKP